MEKQKAALQRAVSWNDVFSTADQRKKIMDTKDQMLEVCLFCDSHMAWCCWLFFFSFPGLLLILFIAQSCPPLNCVLQLQFKITKLACQVNYSHQRISDEMAQLQTHHDQQLEKAIRSYVEHKLASERVKLQKMQALFDGVKGKTDQLA
jgi:hypothetical protein